ncbi:DEAD/DEAH box helicase [Azospirillum sp. A23]|uniref:DEAD/DEAH box helicase n=1 Tax=Azospirillum sp. A23 TaxID=3160608 RepID=UPI0036F29EC4
MIELELYDAGRPIVIMQRRPETNAGAWARLQEAFARGIVGGSPSRSDVRADVFMAELDVLRDVRALFSEKISLGPNIEAQLRVLASDRRARETALAASDGYDLEALAAELEAAGFKRKLKPFQLRNLAAVLRLPHAADFSVPGAGKTTVGLANFALSRARGRVVRLLVIAPIAAFGAWTEDSQECLAPGPKVVIHGGPETLIPQDADILLTNYNRVASDYDRIRAFAADRPTQVILDEAHRVKKGAAGVHGRAVLDLAYAAKRRDVLTGTPAPQGAYDLVALMRFLYPGQDRQILPRSTYVERDGRDPQVLRETHAAVSRYFVRTPKSQLDLPPTRFCVVQREMRPLQKAIYEALVGRYHSSFALGSRSRHEFQNLGRIVMYLLEAATNPMLLTAGSDDGDDPGFAHPPLALKGDEQLADLLHTYNLYETPWKYEETTRIVATAASRGEKVLIWSNFVRNLKVLHRHLEDHQPAMIHGGVPSSDGTPVNQVTREDELRRFRHDPDCRVLLANPAACGEGVSLHHWCHHAVYLDRSFNAGHFLQSQDRIHRLGLAPDAMTRFTLLMSAHTIDVAVDGRLRDKVTALARLMDDPGLVQVALPEPDEGQGGPPAHADDLQAVAAHFAKAARRAS